MKAEITATGTLVLTPETSTEAYALQCWADRAVVKQVDTQRAETFHYRGTSMQIDLSSHPETLDAVDAFAKLYPQTTGWQWNGK